MAAPHRDERVEELSVKMETSLTMDKDDKMDSYHSYVKEGKNAARQGDLSKALEFFKLAHNIHPNGKLQGRIEKIEELLAQEDSESQDEEFVNIKNSGLMIFKDLHDRLYDHQREGVAFLYSLYRDSRKGGILADDMGLGKTIQVISFLSGMYDAELVKHTLIVMPTSLIINWTKEFAKWTPGMRVKEFHGTRKAERIRQLDKIQRRGGVIITTYQMLINNWQQLASYNGKEFKWDYLILDEAHKIKTTSTKTAKSAYAVPARNRILLTGTPVQNNLREMWALFDFACQGALLGTAKTFKTMYENPITRAREKDATPGEKALGLKMSETLITMISPYFLRRTKAELQKRKQKGKEVSEETGVCEANQQIEAKAVMPTLTRKNDLIVWTYLSAVQEAIYRQFLSLDHIKELLMTTRSPLAELNVLKKLCDHPRLLSAAAVTKLGLEETAAESQQDVDRELDSHSIGNIPDEALISESGKLVFLISLLERLKQEGHRTLVFAHYKKVLDIMQRVLVNRGFKVMRMDGTITQLAERERLISLFQEDKRYSVFLLTTQVGGVGITLTAANRVVIFDPSWNPATDAQAVDRAYRIGQTENVVIYRLITCGTVEEKIYRRQVFKDSLIRQMTGDKKNPFRYFSKQELKELFMLEDTRSSTTQQQLQSLHSRHRRTDPELDEHIAHLHSLEMFGISDHDLIYSLDTNNHDDAPQNQASHQYIKGRVHKAQELMKAESELNMQLMERMSLSTEPAWLRQPVQPNGERSNEKKPRKTRPSPSLLHDDDFNKSSVLMDLNQSASDLENNQQNQRNGFVDLTDEDKSLTEKPLALEVSQDNVEAINSSKEEQSVLAIENVSVQEMEDVAVTAEGNISLDYIPSAGISPLKRDDTQIAEVSVDTKMPCVPSLLSQRDSALLMPNTSKKAETSSNISAGLESFEGNFNLHLEDSDMFTGCNIIDEHETESQERKLLSQLQMEGSFDIEKSLSDRRADIQLSQILDCSQINDSDGTMENFYITTKKKRAAVIYDSEEEEDQEQLVTSQLDISIQALGASTPKSFHREASTLKGRKSVGGNTSVASRVSFIQSLMEDIENPEDDHSGDDDYCDGISEDHSHVTNGDDVCSSHDKLELEETNREMLNTEDKEEGEDATGLMESTAESGSGEELGSNFRESTSDIELASDERVEQYTVCTAAKSDTATDASCMSSPSPPEGDSYDSLVRKGKQFYCEGKLDKALECFLRAIDIKSGDPEIQLMTIQVYRQLTRE